MGLIQMSPHVTGEKKVKYSTLFDFEIWRQVTNLRIVLFH